MKPDYTESLAGRAVLELFDHRLRQPVADGAVCLTVVQRGPDLETASAAIAEALLRYLTVTPSSTAHEYLRGKVERTPGVDAGDSVHRLRLTPGELEHLFGMDELDSDYVRLDLLAANVPVSPSFGHPGEARP